MPKYSHLHRVRSFSWAYLISTFFDWKHLKLKGCTSPISVCMVTMIPFVMHMSIIKWSTKWRSPVYFFTKQITSLHFSVNPNFHFVTSLRFNYNHVQITRKRGNDHITVLAGSTYVLDCKVQNNPFIETSSSFVIWNNNLISSGGSRISRRGGAWTPEAATFRKICTSKRKNWVP